MYIFWACQKSSTRLKIDHRNDNNIERNIAALHRPPKYCLCFYAIHWFQAFPRIFCLLLLINMIYRNWSKKSRAPFFTYPVQDFCQNQVSGRINRPRLKIYAFLHFPLPRRSGHVCLFSQKISLPSQELTYLGTNDIL